MYRVYLTRFIWKYLINNNNILKIKLPYHRFNCNEHEFIVIFIPIYHTFCHCCPSRQKTDEQKRYKLIRSFDTMCAIFTIHYFIDKILKSIKIWEIIDEISKNIFQWWNLKYILILNILISVVHIHVIYKIISLYP